MENILIIKNKQEFFEVLNEWDKTRKSEPKNENTESEEIYFTQREAAGFLRISLPTIISWKRNGKVPFYQNGRTILFKKSEILEAMKNQKAQ